MVKIDSLSVLIKTILQSPSPTDINKIKTELQSKLGNININTNGKGLKLLDTNEIDLYQRKMKNMLANLSIGKESIMASPTIKKDMETFLNDLTKVGSVGGKSTKELGIQFSELSTNVRKSAYEMSQLHKDTDSFFTTFTKDMGKLAIWVAAAKIVFFPFQKLKENIIFIEDMNKLFINLQMEMTNTNLVFKDVTNTANEYAKAMGTTTNNVMKAMSVFSTYTSTMDEVLTQSKAGIILSNITGQNIEQTADALMGTLAQFKLAADDSMHVADIIAGTARNLKLDYPRAVQEISDGLRTVGSVANESKVPIELLSSMLGTLSEKTRRSGTEIANGLRTIFGRILNVGEDADPEAMKKVEKQLNNLKISIREIGDPTSLRPVGDILADLAAKWDTLNDAQRQSIAFDAAGMYRKNIFMTMMSSYSDILKNNEAAINSNGVAMQKQEIFDKSLLASKQRLTAAWEDFYLKAFNSEVWKDMIDSVSGLINILNVLINNPISSFLIKITVLTASLYGLGMGFKFVAGTQAALALIDVFKALTASTTMFQVSLGLLTKTMWANPLFKFAIIGTAVITAIYGIVEAVDALTVSIEEQKEKVQTLSSDFQSLQSERDKLSAKDNRTAQEEKHLKVLEAQIEAQKTLLAEETKRLINRQYSNDTEYQTDVFMSTSAESNDINKGIINLKQYNDELANLNTTSEGAYEKEQELNKSIADTTISLGDKYKTIQSSMKILEDTEQKDSEEYKTLVNLSTAIEEVIKNTNDKTDATNKSTQATKDSTTATKEQADSFKSFAKTFKDSTANIKELNGVLDELDKGEGLSANTIDKLLENHSELAVYLNDEVKLREKLNGLIQDETNKVREAYIQSSMSSEAFYNNNQTIVQTFFDNLKSAYDIDIGNWTTLAKAKLDIDNKLISLLKDNWKNYFGTVLDSMGQLEGIGNSDVAHLKNSASGGNTNAQEILNQLYKYKDVINKFDNIASTGFDSIKLGDLTSTKDSKSSPSAIDYTDTTKAYVASFNSLVDQDNIQEKLLEKQIKISSNAKDYNKEISQQNNLLLLQQKTVTDLQTANEGLHQEAERVRSQSQYDTSTWFDSMGNDTLAYLNLLNSFAGATDNASKQQVESIKQTHDALQTIQSAWRSNSESIDIYNTKMQDTKQKTKELVEEAYQSIIKQQKSIDQATLNAQEKVLKAQQKSINAEIKSNEDYIDQQQEFVDSQIDALETQLDLQQEIADQKIDTYQAQIDALEEVSSLEDEITERQERQLEIQKLQTELDNTLKERNKKVLTKQADGTWKWQWTYDTEKVDELNDSIKDKQEDFNKWEIKTAKTHEKERLQALIDAENKRIDTLEENFNDEKDILENNLEILESTYNQENEILQDHLDDLEEAFNTQKDEFDEFYNLLENTTAENLDSLNTTFGNKYDVILATIKEKVAAMMAQQAKIQLLQQQRIYTSDDGITVVDGLITTTPEESGLSGVDYAQAAFDAVAESIESSGGNASSISDSMAASGLIYADGGETQSTGLHWLDGTKGRPERVLSSEQTKSFNKLVDYLPNLLSNLNISSMISSYIPKIATSNLALAGGSLGGSSVNYYISGVTVKANNGEQFISSLTNMVNTKNK